MPLTVDADPTDGWQRLYRVKQPWSTITGYLKETRYLILSRVDT